MPVKKTFKKYFGVVASFFGHLASKISIFDFSPYQGLRILGSKSADTFCRALTMQIPFCQSVLGLGGHRLQSLSTFHRVVKKLARFYGQFFLT